MLKCVKINKNFVLSILLIIVWMLLTGCSDKMNPSDPQTDDITIGQDVSAPDDLGYYVRNDLKSESISDESDIVRINYISFSGLKSKVVQDKINQTIKEEVMALRSKLEPETIIGYRGIKTLIDEDAKVNDLYLYADATFSYNHILSVQVYGFSDLKPSDSKTLSSKTTGSETDYPENVFVSVAKHLNFDLNTGKQIPLKALFVDGYDYESVINQAVMEQIQQSGMTEEENDFFSYTTGKLVAPFDGIDENQPYGLSDQGIIIYFTETDPRFDTDFQTLSVYINFSKFDHQMAIEKRFVLSEESLFETNLRERVFTTWATGRSYRSEYMSGTLENARWSIQYSTLEDIQSPLLLSMVEKKKQDIEQMTFEGSDNWADAYINLSTIGRYKNVSSSMWIHNNNMDWSMTDYIVLDEDDNTVVLDEMFVSGFDYDSVIFKALVTAAKNSGSFTELELKTVYDASLQFQLDRDLMRFVVTTPNKDITLENIIWDVPYVDFGYEHLTVFD